MGIQWQDYFDGGNIACNDHQPLLAKKTTYSINGDTKAKKVIRPVFTSKKVHFNVVHKDQEDKLIMNKLRTIPVANDGTTFLLLPDNKVLITRSHLSFSPKHRARSGWTTHIREFQNKVNVMSTVTPSVVVTKEVNNIKASENNPKSANQEGHIEIQLEIDNNTNMIMKGSTSELIEIVNDPTNTYLLRLSIEYSDNDPKCNPTASKYGHIQIQVPMHIGDKINITGQVVDEAPDNKGDNGIKGILKRFVEFIKNLKHD